MDLSSRQPRKWTPAEDQRLREEVEAQLIGGEVKDWCRIAAQLPGRTNKDCRKRWHNSVAGGLKKGQWSKSEDELLSRGVELYGQRWTLVANCVGSRSADQCAKRWQQSLDPDLDRSEWRDAEDHMLIEATQRLGRHWKDIQKEHFPGRSKNCIKNRYTVLVRRYQNQGITLPSVASSPSESNALTPRSSYADDDPYLSPSPGAYDSLMPAPSHATSSERHRSWSSLDSEAYSTWSSPQEYSVPIAITGPDANHTTTPMAHYAFAQPQPLVSNIPPASGPWDWTTASLSPVSPIHAVSPGPSPSMSNPSFYEFDGYPVVQQPMINHSQSYAPSPIHTSYNTMPNRLHTNVPRLRTTEHQIHGSHTAPTYSDPRHPRNSMYRY